MALLLNPQPIIGKMQHNVHVEKKHISHYLRSRIISSHSTIALIMLKTKDVALRGGLHLQSWTDSHSALANENGVFPEYPIAQGEV